MLITCKEMIGYSQWFFQEVTGQRYGNKPEIDGASPCQSISSSCFSCSLIKVLPTNLISFVRAGSRLIRRCLARPVSLDMSVFIRSIMHVRFVEYLTGIYFQLSWVFLILNGRHFVRTLYIDQYL